MRAAAGIFMALFYQTPVMDFILLKEQTGVKRKKKDNFIPFKFKQARERANQNKA